MWYKVNKILFDSVFSNLRFSWAVTTDQSKSAIVRAMTPLGVHKSTHYPKLCVFFSGALTSISMSKITPNYTYLSTPHSNLQIFQQWHPLVWVRFSQTLVFCTLLSLPCEQSSTSWYLSDQSDWWMSAGREAENCQVHRQEVYSTPSFNKNHSE